MATVYGGMSRNGGWHGFGRRIMDGGGGGGGIEI